MNVEINDISKEDNNIKNNIENNIDNTNIVINEPIVKKKRGRPRKYPIDHNKNKIKKKRGRPKGTKNKTTKKKNS